MCTACLLCLPRAQGVRTVYQIGHLTNCRVSTLRGGGRKSPEKSRPFNVFMKKNWLFGGSSPRSFISQPLFISSNHWVFLVAARGSPGLHMYLSVEVKGQMAVWHRRGRPFPYSINSPLPCYDDTCCAEYRTQLTENVACVHQCTCYVPSFVLRSIRSKSWSSHMSVYIQYIIFRCTTHTSHVF